LSDLKGEKPSFPQNFTVPQHKRLALNGRNATGKTPSRKGFRGKPGGQQLWLAGHTLPPKILAFFPKFPYKPLDSLLPLILEIWKENFEKEILEKGNPNLGITMPFRSSNLWM
jgi:hypothetical protein